MQALVAENGDRGPSEILAPLFRRVWTGRFAFDAELPLPKGVSFVAAAHYRAEVAALPAELRIEDETGIVLARFDAPTDVAPPYTMHLALAQGRPAVFATKDGATRFVRADRLPAGFDPRRADLAARLSVRSGGGAGPVSASLSAGVGQADVRFVARGREGRPHVEDGRLFFTFSERFLGSACGVGSLDPLHPERGVRFEGTILFDYGDGLLRDDLAPHLFFDEESGQWRGWACNFSTGGDDTGGRAPGGVNAVWSETSPLHGLSVMRAKPLGLDGMNEDPCGIRDAEAGKWRLLVSTFTEKGIRARLLESDRWDGGFRPVSGPVAEDSTGTTIAELGGVRRCLCGSADRAYRVYAYPSLEKVGALRMDPPPWGNATGWPHGRGWPAVAPLPPGGPAGHLLLTMDRENFPGMPSPNWTYGALSLYVEAPPPVRAAAVGRVFEIREFTLHDGPGVRTTVFLKGCPLRCAWCHNPEGQSFEKETMRRKDGSSVACGEDWSADALAAELLRNADIMAQSGGGVTFSGGEPLAQAAFVCDVADRLRAAGVACALETSGHAPEADYRAVVSRMAFVYQDLKHHDADAFRRWCGGDLALVLRNLDWLRGSGVPFVLRVPCIPGVNDAPADREALLRLAGPGTAVEFLPYNPAAPAKYPLLGRAFPLPCPARTAPRASGESPVGPVADPPL